MVFLDPNCADVPVIDTSKTIDRVSVVVEKPEIT